MKNAQRAFSLIELSIVVLIIGVLIAGVTQGSRLISQAKLSTARSLTESSPVSSIKGIVTWIESTSTKSFDESEQEDGTSITNVYDLNPQSISKINFFQNTTNNKPTYNSDGINGLPTIYFNGTTDYIESPTISSSTFSLNNRNHTVFLVAKIYSGNTSGIMMFQYNSASRFYLVIYGITSKVLRFDFPNDTSGQGLLYDTNAATAVGRNIIITTNANGTNQTIYINGASYVSQANNLSLTEFSAPIIVGSATGTSNFTEMDLGELIIFDHSLKNEERESIENYLSKKWGIKITE